MEPDVTREELAAKVQTLHALTQEIYRQSDYFPAISRNAKRALAAVELMLLNLETPED